jgi:hypothetical protein
MNCCKSKFLDVLHFAIITLRYKIFFEPVFYINVSNFELKGLKLHNQYNRLTILTLEYIIK